MSTHTFLYKLLNNHLEFIKDLLPQLGFLLQKVFQRTIGYIVGIVGLLIRIIDLLQQQEILTIERKHHIFSLGVILHCCEWINVFNDLTSILMKNQLGDRSVNLWSKIPSVHWWSVIISFLSKVIWILLRHQLDNELFDLINDECFLVHWAMLDHSLYNTASIMFIN